VLLEALFRHDASWYRVLTERGGHAAYLVIAPLVLVLFGPVVTMSVLRHHILVFLVPVKPEALSAG